MLNLDKRAAQIGNAIPCRSEMHGEDSVTALDIPLSGVMIGEHELNALMQDPYAYAVLFNARNGDKLPEPSLKNIKPLSLTEKVEGANVTIIHGVTSETIKLTNVKIAKIKLEPKVGGLTELCFSVQCTPDLNDQVAKLLGRLNSTVEISIDGGQFGAQQELPLNTVGAGESNTPSVSDDESMDSASDVDPFYEAAKKIVIATNVATSSILQQQLRIDNTRAQRLLEQLEQAMVVSPPDETGSRHVLSDAIPQELIDRAAQFAAEREAADDDGDDTQDAA